MDHPPNCTSTFLLVYIMMDEGKDGLEIERCYDDGSDDGMSAARHILYWASSVSSSDVS